MIELEESNIKLHNKNEMLVQQNTLLSERLARGKQKYEHVVNKINDIKANEQQAKKRIGNILQSVTHYNVRNH